MAALAACELHTNLLYKSHSVPPRLHTARQLLRSRTPTYGAASQTFCTFFIPGCHTCEARIVIIFLSVSQFEPLQTPALASHASKRLEMTLKAMGPCRLSLSLVTETIDFPARKSIKPAKFCAWLSPLCFTPSTTRRVTFPFLLGIATTAGMRSATIKHSRSHLA